MKFSFSRRELKFETRSEKSCFTNKWKFAKLSKFKRKQVLNDGDSYLHKFSLEVKFRFGFSLWGKAKTTVRHFVKFHTLSLQKLDFAYYYSQQAYIAIFCF